MATMTLPRNLPGLHDYELLRLLGEGGMGKAFLARHKPSGETVVVKTIHDHLLGDAKTRQRFDQEADLMRRFRHPNAVAFLHASPPSIEPPFIIMEYVPGITLADLMMKHDRLSPLRAGRLLAPLCLFLQCAHDNGLLHRDLTPANVMIVNTDTNRESIKVMDFGLARRIGFYIPSGQLNRQSSGIDGGTPDYICPEQIEGRQVDHRGDLFSVGVLMYGMLAGHVPFEELKNPMDIMLANIHQPPPRFSHWRVTGVPSAVEQLVLSCMSKAPADRPESARALIETYELCLGQRLLDVDAFDSSAELAVSTLQERNRIDPGNVIDQFEAMMMEQTAAMKLRGFVEGVNGAVGECDAGVIKFRLPRVVEVEDKKSMWDWFMGATQQIEWIPLELHMAKKQAGTRSMVDITVVRPHSASETVEQAKITTQFCEQICMELRAYLMVGR
jgi:eukaryotic-like serine/threonine-protein kinase